MTKVYNSLQEALAAAFPKEIERIAKDERRQKFEKAAANGKKLLERAAQAVKAGKPDEALKEVRKDRYACACSLAKEHKRPVRHGFEELERMEKLLALKVSELKDQSKQDTAQAQARKEQLAKALAAQRVQQEVAVA